MKILIIGGTALLGPRLIQELYSYDLNINIATVTRTGRRYFLEQAFQADRDNKLRLNQILQDYAPDLVIDMIPFTETNAKILVSAMEEYKLNIPVIALSSIDIYSAYAKLNATEDVEYQQCPIHEDMALRTKLGAEGEKYDKLGVERIYRDFLANLTILRLPALYGWPEMSRFSPYLEQILDNKKIIEISQDRAHWKFSRCLHKNAAYAIFKCIQAQKNGQHIYNVAEEKAYSEIEWCRKIVSICGWDGEIKVIGTEEDVDLKQNFYVSSEKIRKERDFTEKYSPEDGLAENILFHLYNQFNKPYKKYY